MNLSFLFGIRKLYFPLIIGTFLCTSVIANPESSSVYVKTRLDITLEQLSHQLDIPSDYLADLNDCNVAHKFSNNEWVRIPAKSINTIRFIVALDDSEIRRTLPIRSIFSKVDDNLAKIASRYEVPLNELTRLNPGLNPITRLAVDTPIKLFQPLRARNTLAVTPGSSGGLSWPGLPDFGIPTPKRKAEGICSDLSTHQAEVDTAANPSIQRLMALQRRNASRDACNVEKAESDRRFQDERNAEIRRNRVNWKTYGEVQIPWGLWFEPLAGKRVNGFLGSSNSLITWVSSIESYGPTGAPNGISVSCSTGTFSINTNPNWNRVQSGWTKWAAPARDSNWERIVIDLCSPIVNR